MNEQANDHPIAEPLDGAVAGLGNGHVLRQPLVFGNPKMLPLWPATAQRDGLVSQVGVEFLNFPPRVQCGYTILASAHAMRILGVPPSEVIFGLVLALEGAAVAMTAPGQGKQMADWVCDRATEIAALMQLRDRETEGRA